MRGIGLDTEDKYSENRRRAQTASFFMPWNNVDKWNQLGDKIGVKPMNKGKEPQSTSWEHLAALRILDVSCDSIQIISSVHQIVERLGVLTLRYCVLNLNTWTFNLSKTPLKSLLLTVRSVIRRAKVVRSVQNLAVISVKNICFQCDKYKNNNMTVTLPINKGFVVNIKSSDSRKSMWQKYF